VRHIVFARPQKLDRAAYRLGDFDRLRDEIDVDAPPESSAKEGGAQGDLIRLAADVNGKAIHVEVKRVSLLTQTWDNFRKNLFKPLRQVIESVNWTFKGQLDLERHGGKTPEGILARVLARDIEHRYTASVQAAPADQRVQALAEALSADGYAASIEPSPAGDQLCQHHCPVAHVAAEFPQLCEAETEAFARLLGRHVQRLSTIGAGAHVCTTAVPRPVPSERTSS
jgi:hypothetical protein